MKMIYISLYIKIKYKKMTTDPGEDIIKRTKKDIKSKKIKLIQINQMNSFRIYKFLS